LKNKVLIISPYFPPTNAADMQRIRMSLPYFKKFGWDATIVTVDEKYSDLIKDDLLLQSVPADIRVHKVKALNKNWTTKFGLGSIALRSLWFYRQKVNDILKKEKFDLIYFSTTQFPVCILGAYWKKRFGTPYVIDMQDPWHSEYYQDKPKEQRPSKYWLSYYLNKYLESVAIKNVDGLISVSGNYTTDLKIRYQKIKNVPSATIPFGSFEPDLKIAANNKFDSLLNPDSINIVYIGRGGFDMYKALSVFFKTIKNSIESTSQLFQKIKLYFIGTSYAPSGQGKSTILPLAKQFEIDNMVVEITDRITYYQTLATLQKADALFIPGSDDPSYTASKIYPYLLTKRPLLAVFHSESPALKVLKEYGAAYTCDYDTSDNIEALINDFFRQLSSNSISEQKYNSCAIDKYSAENLTRQQCLLFDEVLAKNNE
jgi:hypothetical protein